MQVPLYILIHTCLLGCHMLVRSMGLLFIHLSIENISHSRCCSRSHLNKHVRGEGLSVLWWRQTRRQMFMSWALNVMDPGDLWEHKARASNLVWRAFQLQRCPNQDTENKCVFSKLTKKERDNPRRRSWTRIHGYKEIQECGMFREEQAVQCDQSCGLLAQEKVKPL